MIKKVLIEKSNQLNNFSKSFIEDSLALKLINLPDKLSNVNFRKNNRSPLILPQEYFKIVASDLWSCFQYAKDLESDKKISTIKYIALIFGKINFNGYLGIQFLLDNFRFNFQRIVIIKYYLSL